MCSKIEGRAFLPWKLFARLSIAGKMLVGHVVLVTLTLTVVAYVLLSLYRINSLNRSIVTVDIPVQGTANRMIDALYAQNVYEKRFLILRRKDLRHLFWERAREFDAQLAELKELQTDVDLPVPALRKLHAQYGDLFLDMTRKVQGGHAGSAEVLSNGKMKQLVERMHELLKDIPPLAAASQEARMRRISETSRSAIRTTILLCGISTVVSVLAGFLITFYISSSLRKVKLAAGQIAEGNFDYGLRMHAEDEIGDLASAFEAMGRRLKKMEEMSRDASPLTRLPGGIAIERELHRRIESGAPMAFCVMDIDNFKVFNDRYGYAHGNEVIKETAVIIEQVSRTHGAHGDFVGHVGGDDFVVVTSPDHMHGLCTEIIARFDRRVPEFYEDRDRANGYIRGKTRQGVEMKFLFMSLSIAIVTNLHRTYSSALEMSEVAAELKDYAKTFPRSLYVVDKRRK